MLRTIDIFGEEPNLLTFGDPNDPKTRNMWRTFLGGICTIFFVMCSLAYVGMSVITVYDGSRDVIIQVETLHDQTQMGGKTFEDMRTMPVVVFTHERQNFYVDVTSSSFHSNIFVAMRQTRVDEDGALSAEFEEFVPCREVEDAPGYVAYDYKTMFQGDLPLSMLEHSELND